MNDSYHYMHIWLVEISKFIFDMFLEKIMLKDVSSKDADWIRDLRIILIAAQKIMSLMHR